MVIFSLLTFGVYNAYWFISRKRSFKKLETNDWIPYKWWIFMLIFLIISLIYSVFGEFVFTEFGIAVLDSFDLILSFYFVGCLYYSVFRAKEMIENHLDEDIYHPWLLFFFNIWYLQYKINRLEGLGRG